MNHIFEVILYPNCQVFTTSIPGPTDNNIKPNRVFRAYSHHLSTVMRKSVFGISNQVRIKSAQLQKQVGLIKLQHEKILSKQQIIQEC